MVSSVEQEQTLLHVTEPLCIDTFSGTRMPGQTIGTISSNGVLRQGIDVERQIAIDNHALRFQPLLQPGWGRQGIAYGPYVRSNGLAFAVLLTNGHNTSDADNIGQSLVARLFRWIKGSEAEHPGRRLVRWFGSRQHRGTIRRLLWWARNHKRAKVPNLKDNLAVGWFPTPVPANPPAEGNTFIVHATGPENGELRTRVCANSLSVFKGLQNLQIYYVVVLRELGAAYYIASIPKAHGLSAYPTMRPVAIDTVEGSPEVYAGVYQSVLGQAGFRADTRVYGLCISQVPTLTTWYGTAHAADRLVGDGSLQGATAEIGGKWTIQGDNERTKHGLRFTTTDSLAVLQPQASSGLVHVAITAPQENASIRLLWRFQDQDNYWSFYIGTEACQLQIVEKGRLEILKTSDRHRLQPGSLNAAQILDNGETFSLYLNSVSVFDTELIDSRLGNATGVGLASGVLHSELWVRSLEAHPRNVPIPPELDLGPPWSREGTQILVTEQFEGSPQELLGKVTTTGHQVWRKEMGSGRIELSGSNSAKVSASPQQPNPGRTAYTIPWNHSDFADVQVEITPPGSDRGQQEKGRAGLLFWQDADNYIIVNNWLDDFYGGASISSFFYIDGFEEIYDAIWTNVGSRVVWGVPYTLRVVFDGLHYIAFVNDEPVLYRALTDVYPDLHRLAINRIGIVANWEWGNDTGSQFKNFVAKV